MTLILAPKDSMKHLEVNDVDYYFITDATLVVVFNTGAIRHYPLIHIWYVSHGGTE